MAFSKSSPDSGMGTILVSMMNSLGVLGLLVVSVGEEVGVEGGGGGGGGIRVLDMGSLVIC